MNELNVRFKWEGGQNNLGNLLPTEINRHLQKCAQQLGQAAGKPIAEVTYEFQGKTHTVPIGAAVGG